MMNDMKIEEVVGRLTDDSWVGESTFVQITKQRLKLMSVSDIPVLIVGKEGTGKRVAAKMLYEMSERKDSHFIELSFRNVEVADLNESLIKAIRDAKEGCLYLSHLEVLDEHSALLLKRAWPIIESANPKARIIVSTSESLPSERMEDSQPDAGKESVLKWLHYNCLNIELPTLSERCADIRAIVQSYQRLNPNIAKLCIQDSAWKVLTGYSWPDNVKQLKRCLDKLSIQCEATVINREVLLNCFPMMLEHSPSIEAKDCDEVAEAKSTVLELKDTNANQKSTVLPFRPTESRSIQAIPNKIQLSAQAKSHPGLNKAISYLYNNFKKPLTMEELASHACISSTHLSYLFKAYLGMSFKQVLLRLRIVKAMEILSDNPNRHVTQVCDDVGFCDLSFFVRKFKATVGLSPGAYRDQFHNSETSPELLALVDDLSHPLLDSSTQFRQ